MSTPDSERRILVLGGPCYRDDDCAMYACRLCGGSGIVSNIVQLRADQREERRD